MQLLTFLFFFRFSFGATVIEAAVIGNGQSITLEHGPLTNALATNLSNFVIACQSRVRLDIRDRVQHSYFGVLNSMDQSTVERTFGTGPEVDVHLPQFVVTGKVFPTFLASYSR